MGQAGRREPVSLGSNDDAEKILQKFTIAPVRTSAEMVKLIAVNAFTETNAELSA